MYLKYQSRLLAVVISSSLLCTILYWNKALALVVRTNQHRLHYVIAESHDQLAFLSDTRVSGTELYFWSGLGTTNEKIYFLATEDSIQKYKPIFEERGLTFTEAYNTVKITYIEDNPDHPNKAEVSTLSEQDVGSSENEDGDDDDSEEVDVGANLEDVAAEMKDEDEIELLILQRLNRIKENSGNIEVIAPAPLSTGLLEVKKMVGITDGESLPMHQGLLYRIQGVQTLDVGNSTSEEDGEWTYGGSGLIPLVGEFLGVSFKWERDGVNPYITAEEAKYWKNDEYLQNKTKSVLWMFVPTEHEKFYEIRNRNYPMSLLVWMYDKEEGEFVLGMETRRNYMRRYQAEGDLRNRALFSLEMISETYKWELRHNRPKFYLITFNQNHVYLFESARKRCSILVVRNSATDPYNPAKTEKIGRPLDMFYITRTKIGRAHV